MEESSIHSSRTTNPQFMNQSKFASINDDAFHSGILTPGSTPATPLEKTRKPTKVTKPQIITDTTGQMIEELKIR